MFQKFVAHRSVQSCTYKGRRLFQTFSVQTLIFELRSADCLESMPSLSLKTPRKNSSCKCNVNVSCFCERLPDVRSHLRPRWSRRTINHNASQSTKTAIRTRSGRLVELALRSCSDRWSDQSVDSWTLLLFWAFIHFEGNWACLLATGSHRYRGQSAQRTATELGDRRKENEKEREVEAYLQWKRKDRGQGARRLPRRPRRSVSCNFLQFSSLFGPKVPRVDFLGSLWIFYQRKARRVYSQKPSNRIGYSGVFCDILRLFEGYFRKRARIWLKAYGRIALVKFRKKNQSPYPSPVKFLGLFF